MRTFILYAILVFAGSIYCTAQHLPSVQLKDMDGKTVDTSTLNNEGKPFIISFFADWCKPCLRELVAIHDVYEEWQEETGVKLIAVSVDDAQNTLKVKPTVQALGWRYDILLDTNSEFKRAMGVNLIPAIFIIDGNGKIVFSRTGYTSGSEEHLINEVRKLVVK
jgi:peroxiredoxin